MAEQPVVPTAAGSARGPLICGEILFDEFPDGSRVLGGAPFNVAWHLQGFGVHPRVLSRVGEDQSGHEVRAAMRNWGMQLDGVQPDTEHPTGCVTIRTDDNGHSFEILPDQAYDYLDTRLALQSLERQPPPLAYLGSLITRNPVSRACVHALLDQFASAPVRTPVFVDINLRAPWWERSRVESLFSAARWLKLNDEELITLTDCSNTDQAITEAARNLRQTYALDLLILTRGAAGASLFSESGHCESAAPAVDHMVDTVGAGDAYASVCILGLLRGWELEQINQRALTFAAAICAQRGATAPVAALYQEFASTWQ